MELTTKFNEDVSKDFQNILMSEKTFIHSRTKLTHIFYFLFF
jgi:hypothetical protein